MILTTLGKNTSFRPVAVHLKQKLKLNLESKNIFDPQGWTYVFTYNYLVGFTAAYKNFHMIERVYENILSDHNLWGYCHNAQSYSNWTLV